MELIIGANGYLGQYLAAARRGCDCVLHSRAPASALVRQTELPFIQEDLVESRKLLAAIDPQTVYLFARPATHDAGTLIDFTQNVQWLLQEWADRGCLRRVVFASTQLVYATPPNATPLPINSPLGPETAYDCHKAEMEFFLALLAHHKTPLVVEIFRLPLLAGRAPTPTQAEQQYLFQWREDYRRGNRWFFPADDGRHMTWGNSWAHVDDVVDLMINPRPPGPAGAAPARCRIIQPVSGHLSYVALDAFFKTKYTLPPQRAGIHLPVTSFYLQDNADTMPRPIEDAFPEILGAFQSTQATVPATMEPA